MKRFCLSVLVSVMAIAGCVMFSSCSGDNSYKLSTLHEDYIEMLSKYDNVVRDNYKFKFDYSKFTSGDNKFFVEANKTLPYSNLETVYNQILNNSLEFVGNYLNYCSTDDYNVARATRDELKKCLDELDNALSKTNTHTGNVANILKAGGDITTNAHMTRLSKLFESYNELYSATFNFSRVLEKIYFENILQDSNTDYSAMPLNQFDAKKVIGERTLKAKIAKQIVDLTENHAIMQMIGSNLIEELTTKHGEDFVEANISEYTAKVNALRVDFSNSIGETINLSDKKEAFHNASIRLYNIQTSLDNNYSAYLTAFRDVVYTEVAADENASEYDKMCVQIIEARHALIQEYNTVLTELLGIINSFTSQS